MKIAKDIEQLKSLATHRKVVLVSGCFDLLHVGHLRLIHYAAKLGNTLVAAINSDESATEYKRKPIIPEDDRAEMLAGLADVDAVYIFNDPNPAHFIAELRPDIVVKGHDWKDTTMPELNVIHEYGGELIVAPVFITSPHYQITTTSKIISTCALRAAEDNKHVKGKESTAVQEGKVHLG